jgi:hypothetical protein
MNDSDEDTGNPYLTQPKKKSRRSKRQEDLDESLLSESTDESVRSNPDLIQRTSFENFKLHLKLLLQKNYWLFSRNIKPTIT